MENNLPIGWEKISLESIAAYVIGGDWGKDEQEIDHEEIFVLRGTDYRQWDKVRAKNAAIRYFKKQSVEKRQLIEGDIILEVSGGGPDQPVGRVVSIDRKALESVKGKLSFSNFFRLIRIDKNINPYFVKAYLDFAYYRGDFNDMQSHTTNLRNLRVSEFLSKTDIPIPPLPEQQRIVAKLDELMEKMDRSRVRLERIPKILKRFRQSVLSAAVSGKLTEEWREKSGVDFDFRAFDFESIILEGPQNGIYKPQSSYGSGSLILRIDNFYDGKINDWKSLKRLSLNNDEIKLYGLRNDDIIINRVNSMPFLGKSAIVKGLSESCVFESNMMRMRVDLQKANPDYVIIFLNSLEGFEELRKNAKQAVNQASINQQDVKSVQIILPSTIDEQKEIVSRVRYLFTIADKIETRYENAISQLNKLPQSVLAKAFRGELVMQDENDEPASVLLKQIKPERDLVSDKKLKRREYSIESELNIAAESKVAYGGSSGVTIHENRKAFAKQVLGGKIISLFKDDPSFTRIKLQKLQYLAEHLAEVDLYWNYYRQSAGPYDPKFMHIVAARLKTSKWYEEKSYKFYPLEKANKIDGYYQEYFSPVDTKLTSLFSLLRTATEDESEIIATLYAVWNNKIIKNEPVLDEQLISEFFEWSDRKRKYTKEQLTVALQWMRKNGIVPNGFGKLIKERLKK